MDSATTPSSVRGYSRVLACALCQQRKVKCDRTTPCSNCVKAGAPCTPSTPSPRRPRRRPNQDLRQRLVRCEELLLQCAVADQVHAPEPEAQSTESAESAQFTPSTSEAGTPGSPGKEMEPLPRRAPTGSKAAYLVLGGGDSNRVLESPIWTALYDELRGIKDLVEVEDASAAHRADATQEDDTELMLSGVDPSVNVCDLQPDPAHTFRLWQLFLDRVNPLTKIIHVPSVQPLIVEATSGMHTMSLHNQALLFSIYLMAVVSLSEDECLAMFAMSKDTALRRYTLGAKASLVRFNFVKNENMAILQALIFYLLSLQGRHDRYACWLLSGTVLRVAHKMGYHRDGSSLGLAPFETEMRRRIWWQIITLDTTAAATSVITPSLLPADSDTQPPLNLNDADLFPASTIAPQPRDGPTEMAFPLFLHRSYVLTSELRLDTARMQALAAAALGRTPSGGTARGEEIASTLAGFRRVVDGVDADLRDLEARCVDVRAGPAHAAVAGLRAMLSRTLDPLLTPLTTQPEFGSEIVTPEDNVFKVLVAGLEHTCDAHALLAAGGFGWWMNVYPLGETLAALAGQLCSRTAGGLAERAWAALGKVYELHPEYVEVERRREFRVQGRYMVKAWERREEVLKGTVASPPEFVQRLRRALAEREGGEEGGSGTVSTVAGQDGAETTEFDPLMSGYEEVDGMAWDGWGEFPALN